MPSHRSVTGTVVLAASQRGASSSRSRKELAESCPEPRLFCLPKATFLLLLFFFTPPGGNLASQSLAYLRMGGEGIEAGGPPCGDIKVNGTPCPWWEVWSSLPCQHAGKVKPPPEGQGWGRVWAEGGAGVGWGLEWDQIALNGNKLQPQTKPKQRLQEELGVPSSPRLD